MESKETRTFMGATRYLTEQQAKLEEVKKNSDTILNKLKIQEEQKHNTSGASGTSANGGLVDYFYYIGEKIEENIEGVLSNLNQIYNMIE